MSMANMHLVTGYGGSGHVTAEDHGSFNTAVFGTGQYVLNIGNKLAASIITNNTIRVLDGDVLIQGRHGRLNEGGYVDLTIENGTLGVFRNDLIVVRYSRDYASGKEECNLVVLKGTAVASNPADPQYTAGDIITDHDLVADMPLYRVVLNGINIQSLVPVFESASLSLADSSVVSAKLADGAVTKTKLANQAVSAEAIASNAVTTAKIANGAVTDAKLANSYVPKSGTTMTGALVAAAGAYDASQVRNISFGTTEMTAGAASGKPEGSMYFSYE